MSSATARPPKPIKPRSVKPWRRVEPGRYQSSDERFALESDGGGRWFVTDEAERDELGLARTTGPFATLGAAKVATDATRERAAAASPLAARLADAASRPKRAAAGPRRATAARTPAAPPGAKLAPEPAPPLRTWLDELAERDPAAAQRAQRLVAALAGAGIAGADALVRRDVLGATPAIAASLLARDLAAAVASLQDPRPAAVVEAVAAVFAQSPVREGLPGWELVERGGPGGAARRLRLAADDLRQTPGVEPEDPT